MRHLLSMVLSTLVTFLCLPRLLSLQVELLILLPGFHILTILNGVFLEGSLCALIFATAVVFNHQTPFLSLTSLLSYRPKPLIYSYKSRGKSNIKVSSHLHMSLYLILHSGAQVRFRVTVYFGFFIAPMKLILPLQSL